MKRNILITGGCGFIGSNFINYFYKTHENKDFNIINLDKLTYAGNINNTNLFRKNKNYYFVQGDICNTEFVKYIFDYFDISDVINFAAETHVDNSIIFPNEFLNSNIIGVSVLLNAAKNKWIQQNKNRFIQISTDEVYGSLELNSEHKWEENEKLNPRSPYSASKASAEHICTSYYNTYKLPIIVTRSSNNYGPYQHKEKFLPVIINSLINNKNIPIYGNGLNIRDWLFVEDNCKAIDKVLYRGKVGEIYNIGGRNELINKSLVNIVIDTYCSITDKPNKLYKKLISYVNDRLGHDIKYSLSIDKIVKEIGWEPSKRNAMCDNLIKTILWYVGENNV